MHLISVDLPAPLSPTSAITSPDRTSKSTSSSALTDPKLLQMPRVSSVGVSDGAGVGAAIVSVTARSCAAQASGEPPRRLPRPSCDY